MKKTKIPLVFMFTVIHIGEDYVRLQSRGTSEERNFDYDTFIFLFKTVHIRIGENIDEKEFRKFICENFI